MSLMRDRGESDRSFVGLAQHAAYCASKGAIDQLTRTMALELGVYGIRVNAVNPTVVLTAMGKLAWSEESKARPMLDCIPLGRFATIDDVVGPVAFLCSDLAAMITGTCIPIDGGALSNRSNQTAMATDFAALGVPPPPTANESKPTA